MVGDAEETSSNSYSGSTVSTLQMKNGGPHINFPPPPLQPSSAYECYANIVVPSQSLSPNGVPFEPMVHGPMNGLPYPPPELIYESLPIEYSSHQYYYDPYSDQYTKRSRRPSVRDPCYECLELQNMPVYYAPSNLREQYDSMHSGSGGSVGGGISGGVDYRGPQLERFGLSKKGLLQIDYSLSWSNLQRFIASK